MLETAPAQAREPWIAARDAAVLTLLYGCGLRISEALGLTGAVLPLGDSLRIAGKGGKERVVPVIAPEPDAAWQPYDIVGPVCESADTFAKSRMMPKLAEDDLVAFRSAGAYGAVMSSEYNTRPLIPEVLVHRHQFAVIRKRPSFDEMINRDTLPPWL